MDRTTAAGKVAALNFLMPYVQRLPNRLLRSEWATRIASELRVDEPVLREALRRAAAERRSEVKPNASLFGPAVKPAERQIIRMLVEADGFREKLASQLAHDSLHSGLECERLLDLLISKVGEHPDPATLAAALERESAACSRSPLRARPRAYLGRRRELPKRSTQSPRGRRTRRAAKEDRSQARYRRIAQPPYPPPRTPETTRYQLARAILRRRVLNPHTRLLIYSSKAQNSAQSRSKRLRSSTISRRYNIRREEVR